MFLIINTTGPQKIELIVVRTAENFSLSKIEAPKQSEKLLTSIERVLKGDLKKVKGIGVVSGPGSFASLRIGVVTANTLAYALKVPVVGIALNEFIDQDELVKKLLKKLTTKKKFSLAKNIVVPFYGQEPNITLKKKTE